MSLFAVGTLVVSLTIYVSSADRIKIDDVGVMIWPEGSHETVEINHMARALIDSSSCAEETYSSGCSSSDPEGCPCTAFTDAEKQQILDLHNRRRELTAAGEEICSNSDGSGTENCPAATDMNALLWDDQLETIATYWAHQCIWDHHSNQMGDEQLDQYESLCDVNGCLAYGYTGDWIAENMATSGTSGTTSWSMDEIEKGLDQWFNESRYYHWDTQTSFAETGHWTAGVWAKSRYIGCGYANCDFESPFGDSYPNWINFVCKMYPGGNYGNGDPYTTGTKCSDCEDDRSTCSGDHSALCDGGMCLNCAVDYFQSDCGYTPTTCPSTMYYGDGITDSTTTTPAPTTTTPSPTFPLLGGSIQTTTTPSPITTTTYSPTTLCTTTTQQDRVVVTTDGTWSDDFVFNEDICNYNAGDSIYDGGWVVWNGNDDSTATDPSDVTPSSTYHVKDGDVPVNQDTPYTQLDTNGVIDTTTSGYTESELSDSGSTFHGPYQKWMKLYGDSGTDDRLSGQWVHIMRNFECSEVDSFVKVNFELVYCLEYASNHDHPRHYSSLWITGDGGTDYHAIYYDEEYGDERLPTDATNADDTIVGAYTVTADSSTSLLTSCDPSGDQPINVIPVSQRYTKGPVSESFQVHFRNRLTEDEGWFMIRDIEIECSSTTTSTTTEDPADPSCDEGRISDSGAVCCAVTCGVCGGDGCSLLPGGSDSCCIGTIASSGISCDEYGAPCILTSSYVAV